MQASQRRQESITASNPTPPWRATRKSRERLRHRSQNNLHLQHSTGEWSAARSVWEETDDGYLGCRSFSPSSSQISCSSETAAAPFQPVLSSGKRSSIVMPEHRRQAPSLSAMLCPASSLSCLAPSVVSNAAATDHSHVIPDATERLPTAFATPEQIAGGARSISLSSLRPLNINDLTNSMRKKRAERDKFVKPSENRNPSILDKFSTVSKSLPALYEDVDSFGTSIYCGVDGASFRREVGCNENRYPSLSSVISSDGLYSEDDDYYSGYGYDGTDIKELSSSEPKRRRRVACGMSRDHLESKFAEWKEARNKRLVNKPKEEAVIAEWERKKTMEARMEMKDYARKLENRRSKAIKKMEKKIWSVERAAQEKQHKEHVATTRRMTTAKTVAVDKDDGGGRKLPWLLIFCP